MWGSLDNFNKSLTPSSKSLFLLLFWKRKNNQELLFKIWIINGNKNLYLWAMTHSSLSVTWLDYYCSRRPDMRLSFCATGIHLIKLSCRSSVQILSSSVSFGPLWYLHLNLWWFSICRCFSMDKSDIPTDGKRTDEHAYFFVYAIFHRAPRNT